MLDQKEAFSSRSSLPLLRDEDDENDELVFFDEGDDNGHSPLMVEEEDYEDYDYGCYSNDDSDLPDGYTRGELEQKVVFVKSSKDPKTGDFCREKKSVWWCIEHGCEEVQPGVWSGAWFFTYLYGEKEGRRAWVDTLNRRLVKECGGKAMKVDHDEFCDMLNQKEKGNRSFSRGQYKMALDCYVKAEKLMGGDVSGMYLVPHQRAEMVKILSNQAECYLRMRKYEQAIVQSTAALQLDKHHQKSMLRRTKAILYGAERVNALTSEIASQAAEDLHVMIGMKSQGAKEAQALLNEIDFNMGKSLHTR